MPDQVVIVDYQLGNLYNVLRVCQHVGLAACVSSSPEDITAAAALILPGVGAFGDAMAFLHQSGLESALRSFALSGRPFLGICLGMQLLMSESYEFGRHHGLGLVPGPVVRFAESRVKVPQVGWNRIRRPKNQDAWRGTLLDGLEAGEYMYFVHSYYAVPEDPSVVLSTTRYGETEFCSSLQLGNVVGCQFHAERSGLLGVSIYRNFAAWISQRAPHRDAGSHTAPAHAGLEVGP